MESQISLQLNTTPSWSSSTVCSHNLQLFILNTTLYQIDSPAYTINYPKLFQ